MRGACFGTYTCTFRISRTIHEEQLLVQSVSLIFSISTAAVAGALSHTESEFVGNLESDFPLQFNLTLLRRSLEVATYGL
jgi:hypothetical protein